MAGLFSRFWNRQNEKLIQQRLNPSVQVENQRKANERLQIIAAWGALLEQHNAPGFIWDVKRLPHDKESILDAICLEMVRESDESRVDVLKASARFLANYQNDIGDIPISQLGVDLSSIKVNGMSSEEIKLLASKIAKNPSRKRFKELQPIIQTDQTHIEAKLFAAEQLRKAMPEEKKRQILG